VYRDGRWYIVGWCHLRRGLRSFRLDRVTSASSLTLVFERPADFDALAYLKQSIAMIPRAHRVEVLLDTDLASAQRAVVASIGVLEWTGSGVLLRAEAEDLDWIARELARLPFDFRVRSPAALRGVVSRWAQRLARLSAK